MLYTRTRSFSTCACFRLFYMLCTIHIDTRSVLMHTYNVWILSCMQKFSKHKPVEKNKRKKENERERGIRHFPRAPLIPYRSRCCCHRCRCRFLHTLHYFLLCSLTLCSLTHTVSQLITHAHQLCMRYLLYNIFVCNEWNGYRLNDIVCNYCVAAATRRCCYYYSECECYAERWYIRW